MNYFVKSNKNLLTYSLIILIFISIFGINLFITFLGNILILVFLVPLLFLLLVYVGFSSFKSKINTCSNCGSISFDLTGTCMNCGSNLENIGELSQKPSESTIEIKAEEIN